MSSNMLLETDISLRAHLEPVDGQELDYNSPLKSSINIFYHPIK